MARRKTSRKAVAKAVTKLNLKPGDEVVVTKSWHSGIHSGAVGIIEKQIGDGFCVRFSGEAGSTKFAATEIAGGISRVFFDDTELLPRLIGK